MAARKKSTNGIKLASSAKSPLLIAATMPARAETPALQNSPTSIEVMACFDIFILPYDRPGFRPFNGEPFI